MPFDALVAPPQPLPLFDAITDQGIAPVSPHVLAAHKQAQLERFAPSFWYRHQPILPAALLGSVACMAVSGGLTQRMMLNGSGVSGWMTLAWMSVIAMLIGAGVFRVRAGSYWEERWIHPEWLCGLGVPEPIAALARQLSSQMPGSTLTLGELKQEYVVLDPYLLIERDGEQVCLGIWDGGEVIACASRGS